MKIPLNGQKSSLVGQRKHEIFATRLADHIKPHHS